MSDPTRRAVLGLGVTGIASLSGCTSLTQGGLESDNTETVREEDVHIFTDSNADVSVEIRNVKNNWLVKNVYCTFDVHVNESAEYNIRFVTLNPEGVSVAKDEEQQYLIRGETAQFKMGTTGPEEGGSVAITVGRVGDQA